VTAEDDVDRLYGVRPEEFTALRKELATAAKKRGDPEAAKLIASARRPTTAAWVVNVLVRADATVRPRLSELTDALRAAHSAMDGARIRELTAAQRKLVNELVRTAFDAAGSSEPTGALRDDVTGTLQAAIADPEVAGRLGRLEKAEQWSGFGDFGLSAEVVTPTRRQASPRKASSAPRQETTGEAARAAVVEQARRRSAAAGTEVEAARTAHAESVEAVADRRAKVATARRRYEKLLETLGAAEREVEASEADLDAADQALRGAEQRLTTAEAELMQADSELSNVTGE